MLCSTQAMRNVGVEQAWPASMAFLHLSRGYKPQGTEQANARVVVVVVLVVVVDVVVVDVVLVEVVEVLVVDVVEVVLVLVVVVDVVVVVVELVFVEVAVVVSVVDVTVVTLGSIRGMSMTKQEQIIVSFEKFHASV